MRVRLSLMRWAWVLLLSACLFVPGTSLLGSRTLKIYGKGFSFFVTEPDGWIIDARSAAQLANFVMYAEGSDWRQTEVIAFGRLVKRGAEESLQEFGELELIRVQQHCPELKISDSELESTSLRRFFAKSCRCPGGKQEIVVFSEAPGFFAIFVLSSNDGKALTRSLPPFEELVSSFRWSGKTHPRANLHRSRE